MASNFHNVPTRSGDFVIFAADVARPFQLLVRPVGRDGGGPSPEFGSPVFIDFQAAAAHAFIFVASAGAGAVWLVTPDGAWDRVHWTSAMRAPGAARDVGRTGGDEVNEAAKRFLAALSTHLHEGVDTHLKATGRLGELEVTRGHNVVNVRPPARALELGVRGFIGVTHAPADSRFVVAEAAAVSGPQPDIRHTPVDFAVADGAVQLEDFPRFSPQDFGNLLLAELAASSRK